MKNQVVIVEICSEGTSVFSADYDLLPSEVKESVDEAFKSEDKSVEIDIYESGLQFLYDSGVECEVTPGEVNFMGIVEFYYMFD